MDQPNQESMDANQLYHFIKDKTNDDIAESLRRNKITGKMLASLIKDQIKEMLPTIGDRIQLIELLRDSSIKLTYKRYTTRRSNYMHNKSVSHQKGTPEKSYWWITSSYSYHQALECSK